MWILDYESYSCSSSSSFSYFVKPTNSRFVCNGPMILTEAAAHSPQRDAGYRQFFSGVPRSFVGPAAGAVRAGVGVTAETAVGDTPLASKKRGRES